MGRRPHRYESDRKPNKSNGCRSVCDESNATTANTRLLRASSLARRHISQPKVRLSHLLDIDRAREGNACRRYSRQHFAKLLLD